MAHRTQKLHFTPLDPVQIEREKRKAETSLGDPVWTFQRHISHLSGHQTTLKRPKLSATERNRVDFKMLIFPLAETLYQSPNTSHVTDPFTSRESFHHVSSKKSSLHHHPASDHILTVPSAEAVKRCC